MKQPVYVLIEVTQITLSQENDKITKEYISYTKKDHFQHCYVNGTAVIFETSFSVLLKSSYCFIANKKRMVECTWKLSLVHCFKYNVDINNEEIKTTMKKY